MRAKYALTIASWLAFLSAIPGALAQGSRGIFVTPIANQPFMAVVDEQRTSFQPDGTALAMKTIHAIARSTQGQIYNESRPLVPASFSGTPPIRVMHIYDPQTRLNTFLYPQQKTGWQGRTPHPPSTVPHDLYATPTASSLPVNQFTKDEDLGTQTMEGVPAHGVRETQTSFLRGKPHAVRWPHKALQEIRVRSHQLRNRSSPRLYRSGGLDPVLPSDP